MAVRKDSIVENLEHFRDVFSMFDTNKDGTISVKELSAVTSALGLKLSQEQANGLIKNADKDGDASLSFEEFLTLLRTLPHQQLNDAILLSAFKKYDVNGDGFITAKELRDTMRILGEDLNDANVQNMISAADTDGDGRVNYEEFLKLMKS